jgi:hypothetical protein
MRTLALHLLLLLVTALALSSCTSTRLVTAANVAPSWVRTAMGGDCDVAAAIDLDAFESHKKKDPESAPFLSAGRSALSAASPFPIPRGKRLAGCLRLVPNSGKVESWVVIAQGMPKADGALFAKSTSTSKSTSTKGDGERPIVIGGTDGIARLFLFSNSSTIILASQSIAPKIRDLKTDDVAGEIDLPRNVYAQVAIGGEAAKRISSEWHNDSKYGEWFSGLEAFEMRLDNDGSHLRAVLHARYAKAEDAQRVEGLIRAFWASVHSGERDDSSAGRLMLVLRGFVNQEIRHDKGSVDIDATYTLVAPSEKKTPPAVVRAGSAPTSDYASPCPHRQRFDLEARKCVEDP